MAQDYDSSGLAPEIRISYDRVMLKAAQPSLVHTRFARKKTIPKGEGKMAQWRRTNLLAPATTPLAEGVTPAPTELNIEAIQVTVNQYGNWITLTDRVQQQAIDPLMTEAANKLGQNAGNTLDIVCREVLNSGTNYRYAGGKMSRTAITSADTLNDAEVRKMWRTMKANNVPTLSNGMYAAFIHPFTTFDLQSTDGYLRTGQYQDKERIYSGRITALYGIMFIETTNAKVFEGVGVGGINVYSTVVVGQDAYADVDIQGLGLETIFKPLGSGGTYDPLNQRSSQGWKASYACVRLNELFILRVEHAVTA